MRNKLYPIYSFYIHWWIFALLEGNSKIPLSFLLRKSATFNGSSSHSSFSQPVGPFFVTRVTLLCWMIAHLILLDFITLLIPFEEYRHWSLPCEIFCVIIYLSSSYVKGSLQHLFSHNLNICKCLRAKDQIWNNTIQQICLCTSV